MQITNYLSYMDTLWKDINLFTEQNKTYFEIKHTCILEDGIAGI